MYVYVSMTSRFGFNNMDVLKFLYNNKIGRIILRPLISRTVSELSGKLLDSRLSMILINPFVRKNRIDKTDYLLDDIGSFNDFFCRRIKPGLRIISKDKNSLIAPSDGLLSVYKINAGTVLSVKQSRFTIDRLLKDRKLAAGFNNGYVLVYRLCVNHYHRYVYFDSGKKYKDRRINGLYHTVRPVALAEFPVYIENTREYSVIDTDNFGRCVQMEVGAMLVGRIVNECSASGIVSRGEEKGHFEYGGSTIIVLIPEGKAGLREDIAANIDTGAEIPVVMGEVIGTASTNK